MSDPSTVVCHILQLFLKAGSSERWSIKIYPLGKMSSPDTDDTIVKLGQDMISQMRVKICFCCCCRWCCFFQISFYRYSWEKLLHDTKRQNDWVCTWNLGHEGGSWSSKNSYIFIGFYRTHLVGIQIYIYMYILIHKWLQYFLVFW